MTQGPWVVKEHGQLNAAVTELREAGLCRIARVEARRRVVRREQDQRVEERLQCDLFIALQVCVLVPRSLRFPTMAQNDIVQGDAAAVVSLRPGRANAP
jgi:hypothetical protein